MSNILKQYRVAGEDKNVRVIVSHEASSSTLSGKQADGQTTGL